MSRLTFLVAVIAAAGCFLAPGTEDDAGTKEAIDGNIRFEVIETHFPFGSIGDPVILLSMATVTIYGCCNYSIVHSLQVENGRIDVHLLYIFMPDICLTALGPASSIDVLEIPPGSYTLAFRLGEATDQFQLSITDSSLQIVEESASFVLPQETLLWRRPIRSFACVCGTTPETSWMCDDFIDSLQVIPHLTEFSFPDSGLAPYPDSSNGYNYNAPSRYFLYATEADFDSAGSILERYAGEVIANQDGIGFSLVNWQNRRYLSWMFGRRLGE